MPLAQPIKGASQDELFRSLYKACPLLNGRAVEDCVTDGTATAQAYPHNLGRAYRGALVYSQTGTDQVVVVLPPTSSGFPTGTDAGTHVLVRPTKFGGAPAAMTFSIWVF